MTNTCQLRRLIKGSGLKYQYIANCLHITRYTLSKKIKNESDFNSQEIQKLCKLLNIKSLKEKERIFFATEVDLKSTAR